MGESVRNQPSKIIEQSFEQDVVTSSEPVRLILALLKIKNIETVPFG